AEALWDPTRIHHIRPAPPERAIYAEQVATIRAQIAPAAFDSAWAAGRLLPIEAMIAEAKAHIRNIASPIRNIAPPIRNIDQAPLSHTFTDALWEQVAAPLAPPPPKKKAGRPRMDDRKAMVAILYALHHGGNWKALPRELGAPSTVHDRFLEWRAAGLFER